MEELQLSTMSKQLIKKLETKNHTLAFKTFQKYNSSQYPKYYATITKKKGGDKTFTYIVFIYELIQTNN